MIAENIRSLLHQLPAGVELVAAAKGRTPAEIRAAISAGVQIIGENYIGEAKRAYKAIGGQTRWHFIGVPARQMHDLLRRNVLEMFDTIETIDSRVTAERISAKCSKIGKVMPVFVEINSGREPQKSGVLPEDAVDLVKRIAQLSHVRVQGLMTMGPRFGDPEQARPYFARTQDLFEQIQALQLHNVQMQYLSMGMTNSYWVAIEEGANLVRIGTKIFGDREE